MALAPCQPLCAALESGLTPVCRCERRIYKVYNDVLSGFFEWDDTNVHRLGRHRVPPEELEQVLSNEPLELEYDEEGGEERFRAVGLTDAGRMLVVMWTLRHGRIR